MTLDEAIERYTSNAEYERAHGNLQGCLDFKKLAEWLKDYKRLLEQESCEDCISRKEVLEYMDKMPSELTVDGRRMIRRRTLEEYISDTLPPVDPQPKIWQKYGKWIERESNTDDKENGFETVIVCSYCDFPATTFYSEDCESRTQIRTHFCPNCGAKMVKPQESEG